MDENDVLLVKQLKDRKEEAFVSLFGNTIIPCIVLLPIICVIRRPQHDIVQELFTDLFEKSAELNIVTSVKAYLFTATRNRCL